MDPLTHTVVGASLAQTRFGRVPLGTATLVVGANLPDIDAATYFISSDLSLGVRRGWTHGVLAMILFPAFLGWVMHRIDLFRCQRNSSATPVRLGRLMALSYIAVLSHPALDWLNTYGVRLLMPFDGTWFYGDSLFIIDPWVWLLLGTTAVLAHSGSRLHAAGWISLGAITTALVTGFPGIPGPTRVLWCLGVATIAGLRTWGGLQSRLHRLATTCLVLAGIYVVAMAGSSKLAHSQVTKWARDNGLEPQNIMVGPMPADPFRRNVLVADEQHYHRVLLDWQASELIVPVGPQTPIGDDHAAAGAALSDSSVWGLATWTRFPAFEIEPLDNGYRVTITDMRTPAAEGRFGRGVVTLGPDLQPR